MVMLWSGRREKRYIIMRLTATTIIPMSTSRVDQIKYLVLLMLVPFIHASEPNGLNMLMKAMANMETKRTIINWFLFSSINLGTFLNSGDVYSIITNDGRSWAVVTYFCKSSHFFCKAAAMAATRRTFF